MSKVKAEIVKKITLEIAGQRIEVSQDEAERLCDALMDLFGRVKYSTTWVYPNQPTTIPTYPSIPSTFPVITYCDNLGATVNIS